MSDEDLVTVAVLQTPTEANLVKNQLDAAGIKAYLADQEAVAMVWHMTGAFGGIKVQVASSDMDDALALLERKAWEDKPEEDKAAVATAETLAKMREDEDEEEVLSDREKTANKAARAAVLGLLFWPLEVYALWLLLKVYSSPQRLTGRPRTKVKLATWITIPVTVFLCLAVVMLIAGPVGPSVDLRELPHPQALVGTWEGTYGGENGKVRVFMQLRSNGVIRYEESGAAETECTGTWGYQNHTFLVCYDRYFKGDSPLKGKLGRYDMEGVREAEMFLRLGAEKVRLVRRE
jgi:hypothetical protein